MTPTRVVPAFGVPAHAAPVHIARVHVAPAHVASAWLPAVLLMLASLAGAASVQLRPSTAQGAAVAAIFPPWWPSGRILAAVAASGGDVLRQGGWTNIFVLVPPPTRSPASPGQNGLAQNEDFPGLLRAAGAWLVVNPVAVGGCFEERS